MKNLFKFLGVISLALVIGLGMAACGGDDGGGGGIEGTWVLKIEDTPGYADYASILEAMGVKKGTVVSELVFKGGNVTVTETDPKDDTEETTTGTYTEKDGTVTITADGETSTGKVDGKKLTITGSDGESITYSKK